jgi:hypothetical protein
MSISGEYRGIKYSTAKTPDGKWKWTLHPPIAPNAVSTITSGTGCETEQAAIVAAKAAIDRRLDTKPN